MHSPTREALLHLIEAQGAPTSIASLARATGWHDNTIRGHVTALWEDGYLDRTREQRDAKGRPSWLWSAKRRDAATPYAELAGVLAESLARVSRDPARDAREAGRSWGLALGAQLPAARTRQEAERAVVEAMRDQGFAPAPSPGSAGIDASVVDDQLDGAPEDDAPDGALVLRQCPLVEAAARRPDVVCAVHLGMVAGVLEAVGARDGGSVLLPFTAPGQCTLRLRVAA